MQESLLLGWTLAMYLLGIRSCELSPLLHFQQSSRGFSCSASN
jgi:hypothetical protein